MKEISMNTKHVPTSKAFSLLVFYTLNFQFFCFVHLPCVPSNIQIINLTKWFIKHEREQAALENVRCEELQLELKSAVKRPSSRPTQISSAATSHTTTSRLDQTSLRLEQESSRLDQEISRHHQTSSRHDMSSSRHDLPSSKHDLPTSRHELSSSSRHDQSSLRHDLPSSKHDMMLSSRHDLPSSRLDQTSKYTTAASRDDRLTGIMSHNSNNVTGLSSLSGMHSTTTKTEPSTVTWAPTPDQKSTEIDRIMAKIEQARLSIANVCVLIRITWNIFWTLHIWI